MIMKKHMTICIKINCSGSLSEKDVLLNVIVSGAQQKFGCKTNAKLINVCALDFRVIQFGTPVGS